MPPTAQGSEIAGTPASTKDATNQPAEQAGAKPDAAGSGAGAPSTPKADPPAAGAKDSQGNQTASVKPTLTAEEAAKKNETLAFLAGKKDQKNDDKAGTPAVKPGDKPAAAPAGKPEAKPDDTMHEPQEPKAKAAFAKMRTELKTKDEEITRIKTASEATVKELKEDADFGREMTEVLGHADVIEDFKQVTNDQLGGVVKIQGALNRIEHAITNKQAPAAGDVERFDEAHARMDAIAERLGKGRKAEIPPFEGELPQNLAVLVGYGDLTEAQARRYAALDAADAAASRAPAKKPATPAAPAARQPAAPAARSVPAKSTMSADDQVYIGMTRKHLVDAGIAEASVGNHYREQLVPIIVRDLIAPTLPAGGDPVAAFMALSPMSKHDMVKRAQEAFAKKHSEPAPAATKDEATAERPRSAIFQRTFGKRSGLPPVAGGTREEQAKKLLAHLAGKSAE